jgi:hypothetical protein
MHEGEIQVSSSGKVGEVLPLFYAAADESYNASQWAACHPSPPVIVLVKRRAVYY